jgi:hypothetical protein
MTRKMLAVAALLGIGSACDYTGDWLFAGAVEGLPAIVHLGLITPVDIVDCPDGIAEGEISYDEACDTDGDGVTEGVNGQEAINSAVIYGEVGPTGTPEQGGVTFDVLGTGGNVCVWVDPELVFWNQSVAANNPATRYSFPDNIFDDGDLDLAAGFSVYYTGTPGEVVGDFEVQYKDSLGETIPVNLTECQIENDYFESGNSHSGRGAPEYCTLFNTLEGVSYTVVMSTWSTPLDDDRLSYGLLVANGRCKELRETGELSGEGAVDECLIRGESLLPSDYRETEQGDAAAALGLPSPSWIGAEVPSWGGSVEHELDFCNDEANKNCRSERNANVETGQTCSWQEPPSPDVEGELNDARRCYCGNEDDTPTGGAF